MALLKYEEIAESLRTRIAAGEFGPGDIVPSGRDLASRRSRDCAISLHVTMERSRYPS